MQLDNLSEYDYIVKYILDELPVFCRQQEGPKSFKVQNAAAFPYYSFYES